MPELRLDPDDGRDVGLKLPRHEVGRYVEPSVTRSPYADLLNDVISRAYLDCRNKVEARAVDLASYGFGLAEPDYEVVCDPYDGSDQATMRIRGTWRIVPLNSEETN